MATIAVTDYFKPRRFYEDILGFEQVGSEDSEMVVYRSGQSRLLVYQSSFAGTNKATAATWVVGEHVAEVARDLKGKGVLFQHYDMEGIALAGDVHASGGVGVAWFKDADENILAVVSR